MMGLKLMAAGVLLLGSGLGAVIFTDFNPAALFIGGAACAFLGVVDIMTPSHAHRPGVSAGDDVSGAFNGDL